MGERAYVTSFGALEALDAAIGRFAGGALGALEAAGPEIERRLAVLEGRADERARAVAYWQQTYDDADPDEDDVGFYASKLEEAEEALRDIRQWLAQVEGQQSEYLRHARRLTDLSTERADKARAFLGQKIAELYEYTGAHAAGAPGGGAGVAPPQPGILDVVVVAAEDVVGSGVAAGEHLALSIIGSCPLPPGFKWVSLDEIDPREMRELPSGEKSGVASADVRGAWELLRDVILPDIGEHPEHANSDYFYELDRRAGRGRGTNSLQGVFDAFFGDKSHLWVDRVKGEPYYRIGNGAHRIKAALDLGLPCVPTKVFEAEL